MKKLYYLLVIFVLAFGCKKDDDISPEQLSTTEVSKTWSLGSDGYVRVDGQEITGDYSGFEITFKAAEDLKMYEVANGGAAFPLSTDTWEFNGTGFDSIVRGDGVVMSFKVTETTLDLIFSIPTPGGRADGTYGEFEFHLMANE